MFLPTSLFIINIFLAVFQFLLVGALGSILAIYSRYSGEYSNSIRWAYYGGYVDMVRSLFKSYKKVPTSVSIVLIATIIASFLSVTADLGASRFIHQAVRYGNDSISYTNSTQRCPERLWCFGWSTWAFYDDNISDVMSLVINSTKNIPNRVDKRIYKPKTISYKPMCNDFTLVFLCFGMEEQPDATFYLSSGTCGDITIQVYSLFEFKVHGITLTHTSQNRWGFSIPITSNSGQGQRYVDDILDFGLVTNEDCFLHTQSQILSWSELTGPIDFPKTYTKNCLQEDRTLVTLSRTFITIQFGPSSSDSSKLDFESSINNTFTESDDELFKDMIKSFNPLPRNMTAGGDVLQQLEIRKNDSSVEVLSCWFQYGMNSSGCTYSTISVILQDVQDFPPEVNISQYLSYHPSVWSTIDIAIAYVSLDSHISIAKLKDKTSQVTDYMARLSCYFFLARTRSFLVFETQDPEDVFEAPDWLVILMSVMMICCACIWGLTYCLLNERFSSSLYKSITMEMVPRINSTYPMLLKARVEPFEIEGLQVISEVKECETDLGSSTVELVSEQFDQSMLQKI